MNICEDKIKVFLDRLLPLQESEQQILCPRCGHNELYTSNYFFLNPLSRYAHVYICEKCWMDEALRELDRTDSSQDMECVTSPGFKRRVTVIYESNN